MTEAPAIHVETLTKRYGSVVAVDAIGFSVSAGRCVGLLGGNGAGKTTTIAMLLGLLTPSAGTVRVLGEDMQDPAARARALARMNMSSPYVDLPHRLTVRENLDIFGRLYGIADRRGRIEALAEELALTPFLDRLAGKLSAGQKTRVALAKALINRPAVLLLDEPTASLDPDTADWVRGRLEAFRDRTGAALLLASHNMGEVERLCDEVLMMKAGRIVDRGPPAELIRRYGRKDLEEVFLHIARSDVANEAEPGTSGGRAA